MKKEEEGPEADPNGQAYRTEGAQRSWNRQSCYPAGSGPEPGFLWAGFKKEPFVNDAQSTVTSP